MALSGTLTHRKTRRLALILGVDVPAALGYAEALWHVTRTRTPAGDIGSLSNEDIAVEMFSTFDPDKLIAGFVSSGFLEESSAFRLIVHDWSAHSDDRTDIRLARNGIKYADGARPRMTKLSANERSSLIQKHEWELCDFVPQKATKSHNVALPVTSNQCQLPVPVTRAKTHTHTSPNGSVGVKAEPVAIDNKSSEFEEVWSKFWIRTGKGAARVAWAKARKKATREVIESAIVLQGPGILAIARQRGSTPVHPSTWLNQERWGDDVGALVVAESPPRQNGNKTQQAMAMFDELMTRNFEELYADK